MREALRELYGLEGTLWQQYAALLGRWRPAISVPSLSAFPTPVSTLIWQSLPWTVGLLSHIDAHRLERRQFPRRPCRLLPQEPAAEGGRRCGHGPAAYPTIIMSPSSCSSCSAILWPILPISGGCQMNIDPDLGFAFVAEHPQALHPAGAVARPGRRSASGSSACVRSSPTSSPKTMSSMPSWRASTAAGSCSSYIMRNALAPQLTGLALSLGAIFNGAIITEFVFGYPGLGTLLVRAVNAGDYSLVLGITSVSIIAVAAAVFVIDLLYPLLDPRVEVEYDAMLRSSAISSATIANSPSARSLSCSSLALAVASFFSPYPPQDSYVVAARRAALLGLSARHQLARPGRLLAADRRDPQQPALRHHRRLPEPHHLARRSGWSSGYAGGMVDRVLMSINDTFVVIPLFPILVAVLLHDARPHVLGAAGGRHGVARLAL